MKNITVKRLAPLFVILSMYFLSVYVLSGGALGNISIGAIIVDGSGNLISPWLAMLPLTTIALLIYGAILTIIIRKDNTN